MANKRDVTVSKHKARKRGLHSAGSKADRQAIPEEWSDLPSIPETGEAPLEPVPPRKRKKRHPWLKATVRLLIVAAVLVAGLAVWKNWDTLAPEALLDWADQQFSGGAKGDGFPYAISGDTVVSMEQAGRNMALLTDTSLLFINEKGGEAAKRSHSYAQPMLHTAGEYALVTETGGGRYQLETRRETVLTGQLEGRKIMAAAVHTDGTVALATDTTSQSYVSEVEMLSRRGKQLFSWKSTKLLITGLAISPDGKSLAVIGVTAEAGAMKSTLMVFDLSDPSAVPKEYSGTDELLISVSFFESGTVAAVGDESIWVVNPEGTLFEKKSYEGLELMGAAVGETSAGIVLRHSGSSDGGRLMVVNSTGDTAYTAEFTGAYRHVAAGNSGFWLLTSAHLEHAGLTGMEASMEVPADGRMVEEFDGDALVLGLTGLNRYDTAVGNT